MEKLENILAYPKVIELIKPTMEEIEYLLYRFNQAKTEKTYRVTPDFMKELEKERLEYQKQKNGL